MINIHPDELYNRLHENASTRKRRTLELIHDVCKKQAQQRSKDFSVGTIAKLVVSDGGPSEQSLRNKNGEDYRLLIKQWADYANTSTKKPRKQESINLYDEILENISDPTNRALIGMLIAENKQLKREISLLKQRPTTIDMRKSKDESLGIGKNTVLVSASHNLTDTELKALRGAISDEFIQHRGWTVDTHGRIKEKGVFVYKTGYVTAIKKVLNEK